MALVRKKGFQEKHKIADYWEKYPYEVVKQKQDGLPVLVVSNNGQERVLHHNMLFLLHYQCEAESNIDDIGEFDSEGTPEQIQDDVHFHDLEDQPVYEGPQTRSHTKALIKANLIMNKYFQIDKTFSPATSIARSELIGSLVGHFLYLQAACYIIGSMIWLMPEHISVVKIFEFLRNLFFRRGMRK